MPIILVRIFTKNDYGNYALILLIYLFFWRILRFGLNQSLFYFIPKYNQGKKYFITNTYLFFLFVGSLALLLLFVYKDTISGFFNAPDISSLLPFCGIHILFMLISCPFESILIIESKAEKAAIVALLSEITRGLSVIIFVIIYKTVAGAMAGLLCFSFLRFLSYSIFILKYSGIRLDKRNTKYFKEQMQYSLPMGYSGILGSIGKRLDKIILSVFFTPEIFAIYTVGNFKIPFVGMFFQSIGEVILPRCVEYLQGNKIKEFLQLWNKTIVRLSFVGIGAFFLLQVIAYDLITMLFTEQYASSVPVFRIILFLIFGQMIAYATVLKGLGRTKDILKSNVYAFIFSIPTTYGFVKYFGLPGAAISAVLIFYVNAFSQLFFSIKKLERKFVDVFPVYTILRMLIISVVIFFILINIQHYFEYLILKICMSSCIFIIVYSYFCYKTKTFNVFQEDIFKKIASKFAIAK
ncbi:MAG: oligosaccharide flippase family protein [Bacteroidetes bacterium]|nr:oligosaccharide flippase family protein [Bacteroidota bacterium]